MRVNDLIYRVQVVLQDPTGVRWPEAELIKWLNDAYREVVLARPDAGAQVGTFPCAEGTRQDLTTVFPRAWRLIDVVRNTASASKQRAVRRVERQVLDEQRNAWHTETPSIDVQNFAYDPKAPTIFYVYPPALGTAQLEVIYSAIPEPHYLSDIDQQVPLRLPNAYANMLVDYVLYRAFTKDAEYAANAQRAIAHYQAMSAALAAQFKSEGESSNVSRQ